MNDATLRAEVCRVGASLFNRGYVHASAGNISVRTEARRLPDHADRRLPRHTVARAVGRGERRRRADRRRPRLEDTRAAPPHLRRRPRGALRGPHALDAPRRADAGRRLAPGRHRAADHALLRDEGRPCAADPLPPPRRSRRRRPSRGADRGQPRHRHPAAPPSCSTASARNVWHRSPAEASAVLEELEETARLWLLTRPTPLTEAQIDELRQQFGARW